MPGSLRGRGPEGARHLLNNMFWKWFLHRRSILEVLKQVGRFLPLKNFQYRRLPVPTLVGDYFGFPLTLEGNRKKEGYRFLATIELPHPLAWRLFLCHEKRKTSFKPVASLKLVTTLHARFNQTYLLLASDEAKAQAIFQTYLCGKFATLTNSNWQLDVHKNLAHLELLEWRLNHTLLCDVLRVVTECLNSLLVGTQLAPKSS